MVPEVLSIDIFDVSGNYFAEVTLVFRDMGYRIPDWGDVQRTGNVLFADSKVEDWTGFAPLIIAEEAHIYELGELSPGTYTFDFRAWGESVENANVVVQQAEDTPTPTSTPSQWNGRCGGRASSSSSQDASAGLAELTLYAVVLFGAIGICGFPR